LRDHSALKDASLLMFVPALIAKRIGGFCWAGPFKSYDIRYQNTMFGSEEKMREIRIEIYFEDKHKDV